MVFIKVGNSLNRWRRKHLSYNCDRIKNYQEIVRYQNYHFVISFLVLKSSRSQNTCLGKYISCVQKRIDNRNLLFSCANKFLFWHPIPPFVTYLKFCLLFIVLNQSLEHTIFHINRWLRPRSSEWFCSFVLGCHVNSPFSSSWRHIGLATAQTW